MTCLGYVFGEIRTILNIGHQIISGEIITLSSTDFIFCVILFIALATATATGIYAFCGESEVQQILKNIRSRPAISIPNGVSPSNSK